MPQVLFICVRNAGRSQIAAALLAHHAFGKVSVRSAGSKPTGTIPKTLTDALAELGVELTESFPKPLTYEVVRATDVVVAMGCGDECPVHPSKRYLDWDVADPGRRLAQHRARHPRRHRPPGARPAVRTSPGLRGHPAVHLDHAS